MLDDDGLVHSNAGLRLFWFNFSNGQKKKERTTLNEHVGTQKTAHFTIVSTTLLIGLNIKFLVRNLRKAAGISIHSNKLP